MQIYDNFPAPRGLSPRNPHEAYPQNVPPQSSNPGYAPDNCYLFLCEVTPPLPNSNTFPVLAILKNPWGMFRHSPPTPRRYWRTYKEKCIEKCTKGSPCCGCRKKTCNNLKLFTKFVVACLLKVHSPVQEFE